MKKKRPCRVLMLFLIFIFVSCGNRTENTISSLTEVQKNAQVVSPDSDNEDRIETSDIRCSG